MYGYNIEEKVTEVLENSRKMFVRRVNFLPSMKQSLITDFAFFFPLDSHYIICHAKQSSWENKATKQHTLNHTNRAVFDWVSKVNQHCFGFALLRSVIGPKKVEPPSQPIKWKTDQFQLA